MRMPILLWRRCLAVVALLGLVLLSGPLAAQQPTSVNPTAASVQEQQLLQQLQAVQGRISIPDQRANVLIQPAGQDWRAFHQVTLPWIGAIAILGMLAVLVLFYMSRGKIMIDSGPSKQRIVRFNSFERFVHWLTAGSFMLLALTGLNITFGKFLLLPVIGPEAFTALSQAGKYVHNYLSFPFMLGLVFMFLVWVVHNLPNAVDVAWLKAGGGLLKKGVHPPAKKFNAGQKLIFWAVIVGGVGLSVTGLILLFPFQGTSIADMQLSQMIHGLISLVLIAVMIAHIYIGSVGMEGAFDAMGSGEVDLNWAKEHHSLWVQEEMKKTGGAGARAQAAE
ncbi:MAG: formate dehydrogenase subunit gamma [Alphaproteobacteria bacterium]|nr:MAG: formate dehydrogenase subunit gamma [Alphaproteobacteria bacterium]